MQQQVSNSFVLQVLNSVQTEKEFNMNKAKALFFYFLMVIASGILLDCQSTKARMERTKTTIGVPESKPTTVATVAHHPVKKKEIVKPDPRVLYAKSITRKYRHVARKQAYAVAHTTVEYAVKYRLDPTLLLGLIAAESSFKPDLVSPMGAVGYTQVMTRYHHDKIKGRDMNNMAVNIQVGAKILRDCFDLHKSERRALGCYNGARNKGDIDKYVSHVAKHVKIFKS